MAENDRKRNSVLSVGLGIVFGAGLGMITGLIFDFHFLASAGVGMALGLVIGALILLTSQKER